MMTDGLRYGMASVVNAQFSFCLLEVATNSFPSQFEKIRDFPDWVPDWQQAQHGKFTCCQSRALSDPADLRSNEFLQTHCSKRRAHE
jgi:hypothetical protein